MKKGLIAAVIIGTLLSLSSCGSWNREPESQASWSEVNIHLNDGRMIHCLIWKGTSKGGPSCDWVNAR